MDRTAGESGGRYGRKPVSAHLAPWAQRRLAEASALIVGVGGLGCMLSQLLARGGVGFLRLVDADVVSLGDLHRQTLYEEADAAAGTPKVIAAQRRMARINSEVRVEPVFSRLAPRTAEALAAGVDAILDGSDNFATRFLINDLAVRDGTPWVFAGVVGSEAQTMTIVPGQTPCLRCVFDEPPPPEEEAALRAAGVLGPAVAAIAALEAMEAIKILSGRPQCISPELLKLDVWTRTVQRINLAEACAGVDCPCCQRRRFDFLSPEP